MPARIAMTATGTTTPIATLAPVESPLEPDDGLVVAELDALVFFALVWVGIAALSLLCLQDYWVC